MKATTILTSLLLCQQVFAQPDRVRHSKEDYIQKYKDDAVKDMAKTGVPASITLSQGILESEFGNSQLAREANNHFGIKCHKNWNGKTYYMDDDEKNECFRKYNSVLESYDDHSAFLRTRDRYASLFQLEITDYKGWAHGLKKAGYATNPEYAHKLIKIIEDYSLNELDKGNQIPVFASKDNTYQPKNNPADNKKATVIKNTNYNYSANQVQYVKAKDGDTYYSIALANNVELWQVLKYNDADKNDKPNEGDIIYLKPKRNKAKSENHLVNEGESMLYISQLYAVKLKKLYRYNDMKPGQEPQPGQKIRLR